MYESRKQAPLARRKFAWRLLGHAFLALCLLFASIAFGMVGYVNYEHLPWIDAFLNSAMLLGGMGPVNPPHTDAGKIFAGIYALYAGLIFIVTAALLLAPVVHRVFHRLHWDA